MKHESYKLTAVSAVLCTIFLGCTNNGSFREIEVSDETGQEIGETMASIDESGDLGGTIAMNLKEKAAEKMFARLAPKELIKPFWQKSWIENAHASSCFGIFSFGQCEENVLVRTFDECTGALGATWDGSVTLTWGGDNSLDCHLVAIGDHISRDPNFTITGLRNAVFSVSKTGDIGQRLTWVSGDIDNKVFEFTNDGIRRVLTRAESTIFDFTNTTTEAIMISGSSRSNRVADGGVLHVENNLDEISCDFTPSLVTWSSETCNCAISGSWTGTCSDGKSYEYTITGCGTADYTVTDGSDVQERSLEFDRCSQI